MVTLTYIDAYQVRTNNYLSQPCSLHSSFSGCVTLPDSYSIVSIKYKGEKAPYTGRVDGLYAFWKGENKLKTKLMLMELSIAISFSLQNIFWKPL